MNTDDLNQNLHTEDEESTGIDNESQEEDIVVDEEAELSQPDIIKKLRAKLKTAVDEKQQYLTNWQRDKAEFVNVRKRDEESKSDYMKFASMKVIEDILPVLDSFDMAMGNKTAWESVSKEWRTGIESIYQQFQSALAKHDVKSFGKIGDTFDPNLHHSIGSIPAGEKDTDHTVAEILQKGYIMKDKVIRPALVKVFEA